jgi:DNA-binding NtrC family response regulator
VPTISPSTAARSIPVERADATTVASVPRDVVERVARSGCTILLTGETGAGKGYLARWIHDHSGAAAGPFVPVNCGAIPADIIDSHLFGHARGSFSGADRDHTGLVRAAAGGTLFLDEVAELPPAGQCRLLRLLEEREVQPVGCAAPQRVDVRIVAATSRDLGAGVARGSFRADLHYRLDVIQVAIAPLRDRPRDVRELLETFNWELAARMGRRPLRFTDDALHALLAYGWPGNVRELRSVVERLHVLHPEDVVTARDLHERAGLAPATGTARPPGSRRLRDARLAAVRQAIETCGGSISRAATALGVHRSTVHRWLAGAAM